MTADLTSLWRDTELGVRRSLELAYVALLAGGLPVGAVVLDRAGAIVAEGRNHAYDPPGGPDPLQGTPIAHAELNALAGVGTSLDLSTMTVWSSHQPCAMCAAACAFTGVGTVRFVAPDPSDPGPDPVDVDGRWQVVGILLFLAGIRGYAGPDAPMIVRARDREPAVTAVLDGADLRASALLDALAPVWTAIEAAAERRDPPE